MRINGNNSTPKTTPAAPEGQTKNAAEAAKTPADTTKDIKKSADRLLQAMNSPFGQFTKPTGQTATKPDVRPDAADPRAKAPDGALPQHTTPESHGATLESRIAGPQFGYSVDQAVVDQANPHLTLDRNELGQGTQTDGRNPNESYRGGTDPGIGNPHGGLDRSAAGKPGYSDRTRIFLNKVNAKVEDALIDGDADAVDFWNNEAAKEVGAKTTGTPLLYTGKIATAHFKRVEEAKTLKKEAAAEAREKRKAEGEKAKAAEEAKKAEEEKKAEESDKTEDDDKIEDDAADGMTEDRTPESGASAPDRHKGFTDQYMQIKMDAIKNSEINPGDQIQGTPMEMAEPNSEQYTANYGEEHRTPTEEEIAAAEQRVRDAANPDEEF